MIPSWTPSAAEYHSGGISIISAVKGIADEVRLGQSGQEDLSGQTAQKSALQTVLKMIWDR